MRGFDPRTSRMLSDRSTIWATSPYSSSFELASEHISWKIGFRFVTSCQFLPNISKYKWELSNPKKCFGDAGHRSPYLSHAKRALYHLSNIPVLFKIRASFEQNSWSISFPFVTSCQFIPIISKYKPEMSNPQKCFGDAGHRSPYLSHAKRALYHLSYIPVMISLRASFWTQFMKNRFSICNELSIPSHYQQIHMRIIESSKVFWRCGASIPVPLACCASALPFELHPRSLQASS